MDDRTVRRVSAGVAALAAAGGVAAGCTGGSSDTATPVSDASSPIVDGSVVPIGPGHIALRLPDNHWHRVSALEAATDLEDLSSALDAITSGTDLGLSLSPDGAWLALGTARRFGCAGGGDCLAWAKLGSPTTGGLVSAAGVQSVPVGRPAIAPGGGAIVYPKGTGASRVDLVAVTRQGSGWSAETNLTAGSSFPFHHDVAFSFDGAKVIFDCGPTPYQAPASSICEVALDGSGFRVVVSYTDGPFGGDGGAQGDWVTHHPAYAPDGAVVFEADWALFGNHNEEIWRVPAGGGTPKQLSPPTASDDNSPCVLPDGRVASLWLGRIDADGAQNALHELKVMNGDGSGGVMVMTGVDIVDVGLSCGD